MLDSDYKVSKVINLILNGKNLEFNTTWATQKCNYLVASTRRMVWKYYLTLIIYILL